MSIVNCQLSTINDLRFPSIPLRPYGKVHPVATRFIPFNEQLVIILLRLVGIFYQDIPVSLRLLVARDPYIHRASRQMIARRHPSNQPIQLRTPIPAINNDRLFGNFGVVYRSIFFPS